MPEAEKMVPVKVAHKVTGKVKIINPVALERYQKAGFEEVKDEPVPAATGGTTSTKGGK